MKPFFLDLVESPISRTLYKQYLDYREQCDEVAAINPIHLSSENRDRTLFPSATNFTLLLPRCYREVKSISITQIEFPSANYTLKRSSTQVRWNEDGSSSYSVAQVSPGSYTTDSLVVELISALNRSQASIDRKLLWKSKYTENLAGGVKIYVYGRSTTLSNNPLITSVVSKFVRINLTNHSFTIDDTILLTGVTGSPGGLTSDLWNNIEYSVVEIVDANAFIIKCPGAEPYLDDIAGGDKVIISSIVPFSFLGKNPVLDMLGFPPCTSSEPLGDFVTLSQWLEIDKSLSIKTEHLGGTGNPLAKLQIGDLFSIVGLSWDNETIYKILGKGSDNGNGDGFRIQRLTSPPTIQSTEATTSDFPLEKRLRISCATRKIGMSTSQSNAFDTGTLYRAPNLLGDTHCFIYLNDKILGKIQFTQMSGYLAFNNASEQALQFKNGTRPDLSCITLSLKDKDNKPLYLAGLEYSLSLLFTENQPRITEYPLREYFKGE